MSDTGGTKAARARTLGEVFSSFVFPAEEKARIAAAGASGLISRILRQYGTRTKNYTDGFRRTHKIPGVRPGSPAYHSRAIPTILGELADNAHPGHPAAWNLYRAAVIDFFKSELSDLDKLLTTIPAPIDGTPVDSLVKLVCSHAEEFNVSADHILQFHEVWGLPRIPEFSSLVPVWMKGDPSAASERKIARLTGDLELTRKALDEKATHLNSLGEVLADLQASQAELLSRIDANEKSALQVSENVRRISDVANDDSKIKQLDDRAARISERLKIVERDAVTIQDVKALIHKAEFAPQDVVTQSVAAIAETLAETKAEIETKIAGLTVENAKRHGAPSQVGPATVVRYRSPLVGALSKSPPQYKISDELEFTRSWVQCLSESTGIELSPERALALHRAFLANHVVVCDYAFVQAWIDTLGWQSFALHTAASPTWSSEEDWLPAAEHVFHPRSATPRLAVVHNYDVGLADCYLAPSLTLWSLYGDSRGLAKVFLVPSGSDQPASHHVLGHAFCLSDDNDAGRPLRLRDDVFVPLPVRRELRTGVDPNVVTKWIQSRRRVDFELGAIQRSLNFTIAQSVADNFKRAASLGATYLDTPSAIAFAMNHQVLPWILARYGETKCADLRSFLGQLPDSAY